jgi:hypothetical protein
VSEMEPDDAGIDALLRHSMDAPVPRLPSDFEQRVMRAVTHESANLDRYGRMVLTGYGLASIAVSGAVMRGQGLGWEMIAAAILGPLAVVAAIPWARRIGHTR